MTQRFYVRSGLHIAIYCDGMTSRKTRAHAHTWLRDVEFDEKGGMHIVREVVADGRLRGGRPADWARERFDESALQVEFASIESSSSVYERWRLSCPTSGCRINVYARVESIASVLKSEAASGAPSYRLADLARRLS